ncbi:hypothetical protein WICPIJ_005726 [Wickerhamomyces pijperi]|uniref:Uncharacterized protein n=1 Tax=Wickerhamomyces pijperi TaxID=599730 RepID=A0A9P8Q556_WICPI|nr:hypothetical protein WICPIJ_005726 [Wickerhamomyces pijperi]
MTSGALVSTTILFEWACSVMLIPLSLDSFLTDDTSLMSPLTNCLETELCDRSTGLDFEEPFFATILAFLLAIAFNLALALSVGAGDPDLDCSSGIVTSVPFSVFVVSTLLFLVGLDSRGIGMSFSELDKSFFPDLKRVPRFQRSKVAKCWSCVYFSTMALFNFSSSSILT